jgi:hypothetical protein
MKQRIMPRHRVSPRLLLLVLSAAVLALTPAIVAPISATAAPSVQVQTAAASCARSWIGHEAAVEEALRGKVERVEALPIGVTKPKRVFFAEGSPVSSAAWKPLKPGVRKGYWESYKSEIAAYELDKLLDMQMVPPTVERQIDGETGAIVFWLDGVKGWQKDRPVRGPEPEWSKQISRMKLFDLLIANIDRNQGNLLYDADWHLFLIDHSRAFTDRKKLSGIAPIQTVDRALWQRIDALTRDDLERVLGPWIDEKAIDATFVRREQIRDDIMKRVAKLGEARVFF